VFYASVGIWILLVLVVIASEITSTLLQLIANKSTNAPMFKPHKHSATQVVVFSTSRSLLESIPWPPIWKVLRVAQAVAVLKDMERKSWQLCPWLLEVRCLSMWVAWAQQEFPAKRTPVDLMAEGVLGTARVEEVVRTSAAELTPPAIESQWREEAAGLITHVLHPAAVVEGFPAELQGRVVVAGHLAALGELFQLEGRVFPMQVRVRFLAEGQPILAVGAVEAVEDTTVILFFVVIFKK
jgi:hypothetical protein